MLAEERARAIGQSGRRSDAAPANAAARATGKTGKRNRNIPDERPTRTLLASQTMLAARQIGVLREARTLNNRNANDSGPKNCQKPRCAWSTAAKSGNSNTCGTDRNPLAPVSASTDARVNEFVCPGANHFSKNGNTGSWIHSILRTYGHMPAASAALKKRPSLRNDRASTRNASVKAAAKRQPVYFAPARAPAITPARMVIAKRSSLRARATTSTPTAAKKAIQISGAPAVEACQKTTGVRRKHSAQSQAHSRESHRRARHALAAAANTPPRKISARDNFSLCSASPVRINKCPWPVKKLCTSGKFGTK